MRQPANHEPNEKMAMFAPWKISFSTWAEYFLPATEVSVRRNSTDFFSFIRSEPMPAFWEDYDRGVLTLDEVTGILSGVNACPRAKCEEYLRLSIDMQEPVKPTEQLVRDLKAAGYKLLVLSNMSREFIDFLRRFPVYGLFDGEVVSCEEGVVKPEPEIYGDCSAATDSILRRRSLSTTARPISPPPRRWVSAGSCSTIRRRPQPATCCAAGCCPK